MPTDVAQDRKAGEAQTAQPKKAPAAPTKAPGKDGLKQSLRAMSYEEGAQALSPGSPADEKKAEEERKAAELKAYQDALGSLIGGKLYEVVAKEVSPDKVLKYANDAVDGLIKAAVTEAGALDKMDPDGQKPATRLAEVLGQILDEKATAWLATDDGKNLAQKISGYVGAHPWQVVSAILLAAASAVAANVSLPQIKQKFKIADGLDAEVKAKLGKVRDISLEAISLRLTYQAGRLKAEAGAERDKDGKITGNVGASYGDDKAMVTTAATLDDKGVAKATLGAKGTRGSTSGEVSGNYARDGGYSADAKVTYAGKEHKLAGAAHYDFKTNDVSVKLSDEVVKDLEYHYRAITFDKDGVGTETRDRYGDNKNYMELSTLDKGDNSKLGLGGQATRGRYTLGADLTYTSKHLTDALDRQFTGKGRVDARLTDKLTVGGDATYDFQAGRLAEYGAYFGYRDPKEFEAFLVEYRRKMAGDVPEDRFKLMVEHTIGDFMVRGQNETTFKGGDLSSGRASLHGAYPINKDFAIIGGVTQGYGRDRDVGTMPQVGVQVRNIPVMVGYDTNSKAWTLGITIPFGR
ncbi:MAG: hypothetical protein FJ087_16430 [Deltaproteobacteria bacterium]|nr:hypothetical protein [Deltaproteobacteria bacterium]